ncbi:hypothetical protein [Streptacidiphilus sp. MAP5-3]|uniref:hypothetical protein n=1 Tax=unclassified Streptacidiphilus TaxID=2643834 RepID=UPI00351783D0
MRNSIQAYAHLVLTFVREINDWRDEYDPGTNEWLTLCALSEAAEQLALSVTDHPQPTTRPGSPHARTLDALFTAFSTRNRPMGTITCGSCGTGQFQARPDAVFACDTCPNTLHAQNLNLDSGEMWAVDTSGTLGKVTDPDHTHQAMTAALSAWLTADDPYTERRALIEFHATALDLHTALAAGIPFPTGNRRERS